jgi:hypothetical protein
MWQLHATNTDRKWVMIASFETVTDATRRIIEMEGLQLTGIHIEMYVDTVNDNEAFGHLEYTGKESAGRKTHYVIKRVSH